jgi:hypothetical protein
MLLSRNLGKRTHPSTLQEMQSQVVRKQHRQLVTVASDGFVQGPPEDWCFDRYVRSRRLYSRMANEGLDGHLSSLGFNVRIRTFNMETKDALLDECITRHVPEWGSVFKRFKHTTEVFIDWKSAEIDHVLMEVMDNLVRNLEISEVEVCLNGLDEQNTDDEGGSGAPGLDDAEW